MQASARIASVVSSKPPARRRLIRRIRQDFAGTAEPMKLTQHRPNQFAAIAFTVAGLIWAVAGLFTQSVGTHVSIGMMNVGIGLMFLALSRRKDES